MKNSIRARVCEPHIRRHLVSIIIIVFILISCAKITHNNDGIIEIKERVFVGQVNDIYMNVNDYLGKTVKIEGLFMNDQIIEGEDPFYAVYRYGPGGCCGIDGIVGFEVKWTDDKIHEYPEQDSWVEVVGILKKYEDEAFNQYLYVALTSMAVMEKRGKEFVSQ